MARFGISIKVNTRKSFCINEKNCIGYRDKRCGGTSGSVRLSFWRRDPLVFQFMAAIAGHDKPEQRSGVLYWNALVYTCRPFLVAHFAAALCPVPCLLAQGFPVGTGAGNCR